MMNLLRGLIRRSKNAERIEAGLREVAVLLGDVAEMIEPNPRKGPRVNRWLGQAREEIPRVLKDCDPITVGLAVGAMFGIRHTDPRRFVNHDPCFLVQTAHAFRHCSTVSIGTYWDNTLGRVRPVYRPPPFTVSRIIGNYVLTAYTQFGGLVVGMLDREHERRSFVAESFTPASPTDTHSTQGFPNV